MGRRLYIFKDGNVLAPSFVEINFPSKLDTAIPTSFANYFRSVENNFKACKLTLEGKLRREIFLKLDSKLV